MVGAVLRVAAVGLAVLALIGVGPALKLLAVAVIIAALV